MALTMLSVKALISHNQAPGANNLAALKTG